MSLTAQLVVACALSLALFGYAALPSATRGAHRRHGLARLPLGVQLAVIVAVAAIAINPRLTFHLGA